MIGPIESALRFDLRSGRTISKRAARRIHGPVALGILHRFARAGIVEVDGDSVRPITRAAPEPVVAQLEERERQQAEDRERQRVREAERRQLLAEIDRAPDEESRRRLIRQGSLLAWGRDLVAGAVAEVVDSSDHGGLAELFGIEIAE